MGLDATAVERETPRVSSFPRKLRPTISAVEKRFAGMTVLKQVPFDFAPP